VSKGQWSRPGQAYALVTEGRRFEGAVLASDLIEFMRGELPSQSKESVMDTFGISAATWVKIKRGEPIRRSTADHLVKRLTRQ
jgi:hypothetical protein